MKKLLVFLTAALVFSSCVREQNPFFGREIAISVGMGRTATKSASEAEETLLTTIPVQMEDGTEVILEAWLSDAGCVPAVDTKGAQLNDVSAMASIYGKFLTTVYEGGEIYHYDFDGSTIMKDVEVSYTGDSEKAWAFGDRTYYWPDEYDRPLTFCSYAPAENSGISNFKLSDNKVLFDYSTPESDSDYCAAEAQRDLLVGLDPGQSRTKNHGNAEVNLKHALTSVKFVCKDWSGVKVDSIRLENFYSSGHASFDGTSFQWTELGGKTSFTQSFATTPGGDKKDSYDNYLLDDSENSVRTFMVIPQELSSDAKITVFLDRTHGEVSIDITKLSALLDNQNPGNPLSNWSDYAGKTITFKVNNAKIDDQFIVNSSDDGKAFSISFTGETPNYVRAAVVVNVEDEKGDVLTSWLGSDFDKDYLDFEYNPDWEKRDDGFYYYKTTVSKQSGAVDFLSGFTFDSSKIPTNPEDTDYFKGIPDHLGASILVQGSIKPFSEWK